MENRKNHTKGNINYTIIDIQAMLVWLTLPFLIIFAVFHPSPLTVCINCSCLTFIIIIIATIERVQNCQLVAAMRSSLLH